MTASAPSPPVSSRGAGPLGRRDGRLLLAGQAASELGSQVGSIALPLVAVLVLGASPFELGVLTAAGTISFAVLALPAGGWVDRVPRRPVLVGADLIRGAALLTVPVAAALQRLSLAQLVAVALAVGMARALLDVAYPSYLPAPGRPGRAGQGQRLPGDIPVGDPADRPGGGRLAGATRRRPGGRCRRRGQLPRLGRVPPGHPGGRAPPGPDRPAGAAPGAGRGARFVLGQPALRAVTACTALTNLLWAAAGTVQLLFLVHEVGLDPAAIGLLVSAGAAGGLLAALAATRVARDADTARLIWLPLTVTAPFALCTPLTAPGWRVALFPLGVAVTSFGQVLYTSPR